MNSLVQSWGRRLRLPVLLAVLCGLSGCLMVPVPKERQFYGGRRIVSAEEVAQLVPGTTTRTDVLLAFGEPDAVSRDGRQFAYSWKMAKAFWLLFLPASPYSGVVLGGDIPEQNLVFLQFDGEGILEKLDVSDSYLKNIPARLSDLGMQFDSAPPPALGRPGVILLTLCDSAAEQSDNADPLPWRIQVGDFLDLRPDMAGTRQWMGEVHDLMQVKMGDVYCTAAVTDMLRTFLANELFRTGCPVVTHDPDYVLTAQVREFKVQNTSHLFYMEATLRADIRITLTPFQSGRETVEWHFTDARTRKFTYLDVEPELKHMFCDSMGNLRLFLHDRLREFHGIGPEGSSAAVPGP